MHRKIFHTVILLNIYLPQMNRRPSKHIMYRTLLYAQYRGSHSCLSSNKSEFTWSNVITDTDCYCWLTIYADNKKEIQFFFFPYRDFDFRRFLSMETLWVSFGIWTRGPGSLIARVVIAINISWSLAHVLNRQQLTIIKVNF